MRGAVVVALLLAVLAPAPGLRDTGSAVSTAQTVPTAGSAPVALPRVGLPGSTARLEAGGRPVVLHVPDGLLAPAPLLVVLHAFSQSADKARAYTRLEELADREGVVVAFGQGVAGSWNAGACCGSARDAGVDDVAYLDAVVALAGERAVLDPERVAVTGFSNGAMMALRYACERADVVSAAAVVAGPLVAPCRPDRPVAVLALHGTGDATVPLGGGTNARLRADFPAVARSVQPFADAGGEVAVQTFAGGGHGWPADATERVWEWVRDHPRTVAAGRP